MAATMGFSNSVIWPIIWSKGTKKYSLYAVPVNKSHQRHKADINVLSKLTYTKRAIKRKPQKLFVVPPRDFNTNTSPLSPAQTIVLFYSAINEKNLKQLNEMIADNCFFEDYSFPKPFRGKKEVLHFLEQLIMCMGQNMQFNVEHICEGNDNSVGVNWHLDWNKIQVPFTRGCSNYSLSVNVDKLVIEKAQIHIESPIKLGVVALTIFKTVSSLFDAFPAATEWFLTSPHIVFQLLLKAYTIIIQPIIGPFLAWYIKLLNIAASILGFTLKILHHVAKAFHK
ncbi:hypothetical protein PHJA_002726400 [Phtheirospermum japonicum]|uniref:SnoaL-like domain-containing protein n=1 Tax=Phtheirospermum japonicum TaxID=374723 RepID=A0A830D5D8_9LAMI|nr:hypothetical protein PHJA_002726400 [Phtheirospermum japonicum]